MNSIEPTKDNAWLANLLSRRGIPGPFPIPGVRRIRNGFSLLEVMIAMAICVLGLAIVLQMSSLAQTFSEKAEAATALQILAQNRMAELAVGLRPLESVVNEACPENSETRFSLECVADTEMPLVCATVTVWFAEGDSNLSRSKNSKSRSAPSSRGDAVSDSGPRPFRLERWIRIEANSAPVSSEIDALPTEGDAR